MGGALGGWARASAEKGSAGVQVPMASLPSWRERAQEIESKGEDQSGRDFDWTYSSDYAAVASLAEGSDAESAGCAWRPHAGPGLEMALLRRTDVPILLFTDLTLYSDDLHDAGESEMRMRLRVMPGCFFVLLRHWLRVDGVLMRQRDTRLFHKFGSAYVVRAQRMAQMALPPLPPVPAQPTEAAGAAAPWAGAAHAASVPGEA